MKYLCPRCQSELIPTKSFSGVDCEFWRECTLCNTFVHTYRPQEHQKQVHCDEHRFIGNFGGYGSGKTTVSRVEVLKHAILTPNANILIGANVARQYEQTLKRELENDLPMAFVSRWSTQKQFIELKNNSRIMFVPFDDADKLRSLNLTMFVIVEASETTAEVFAQLKTRLRSTASSIASPYQQEGEVYAPIADWRKGIIESNPDAGWIRTEVFGVSDVVYRDGKLSKADEEFTRPDAIDVNIATHVASTKANKYLPADFVEAISKNKPKWWVNRYVYSSFEYSDGLVYPNYRQCIIPTSPIPTRFKRIISMDYGLSDVNAFVCAAIDPNKGDVVIYKENRSTGHNIDELSKIYFDLTKDIPSGGFATSPIIDPKSGSKRDYDKKTLADHFLDRGIAFKPGHVDVNARIFRLNTYIERGCLKIMDCCTGLLQELSEYKFKPITLDKAISDNKPIDKNNHSINALEWITMELPNNPRDLVLEVYDKNGRAVPDMRQTRYEDALVPWFKDYDIDESDQGFGLKMGGF